MTPSIKALVGTIALLGFILVYVLAAMLVAAAVLPNSGWVTQFGYYAFAGLAWVPPAGLIISWMYRK